MASILITGGTGSFGGTMARKLLHDPKTERVIIFSRDENKQHEMRQELTDSRIEYVIGDIRDRDSLRQALRGVETVFHAAALKHVPTGEYFPEEMLRTNVLGTENVLAASEECGVEKCVLLSTDKAVYPINALGLTKGLAEKLSVARARKCRSTIFTSVRYGNVMASRGSVIPLFVERMKAGKSITITDPKMTRFLLSLEDAIGLVDVALEKGGQGDLFIRKAPATTIEILAHALKEIFHSNASIEIIGTRAGEKIHETLATAEELFRADDLGDCYQIKNMVYSPYEDFYTEGKKHAFAEDYTSANTTQLTLDETIALVRALPYIKKELG